MAEALGIPAANYSRRKGRDDFPSFEESAALGAHFGCSATVLQIAFGLRGKNEVVCSMMMKCANTSSRVGATFLNRCLNTHDAVVNRIQAIIPLLAPEKHLLDKHVELV